MEQESHPWSASQSFYLGPEGEADKHFMQVRVLEKSLVSSVNTAVENLNGGIIRCPCGLCIVYSASSKAYFCLYRDDKKEVAKNWFEGCKAAFPTSVRSRRAPA